MPRRKISDKKDVKIFKNLHHEFNDNIIIRIPLSVTNESMNLTQEEQIFSYNHLISTPMENMTNRFARIDGITENNEDYHPYGDHSKVETKKKSPETKRNETFNVISTDKNPKERQVCMWCCHDFSNSKFHLPLYKQNDEFIVLGDFCSIQCAASYNFNDIVEFGDVWERYSLLHSLYCEGKSYDKISLAPSRLSLKLFGGHLSIEEFRKDTKLKYHLSLAPIKYIKTYSSGGSHILQAHTKNNNSFQSQLSSRTPFSEYLNK